MSKAYYDIYVSRDLFINWNDSVIYKKKKLNFDTP